MSRVRAVLLDLGGVFYLPDHDRVLAALSDLDVPVPRDRLDEAHYRGIAALDEFRGDDLNVWRAYNRAYVQVCGVAPDGVPDAAEVLLSAFDEGRAWTRIIPGAVAALRELHDLGVGLAVVSNADGTAEEQLRLDEICQVGPGPGIPVTVILDSTVVGVSKPEPAIFHLALEALGVAPEEAIHVGDTPAADVEGAWAAGVTPVLVDPYDLHPTIRCTRVGSLADVPALVAARR